MPEAAPWPVFGFLNEAALDWIAMNVAEFLDEFGMGQDVEVVVAALPELLAVAFETFGGFVFEYVQSDGERVKLRLGDEEVDVLGHEDVTEDIKLVAGTESFEFFEEDGSGAVVVEIGKTAVTTEGDEVIVTLSLIAF